MSKSALWKFVPYCVALVFSASSVAVASQPELSSPLESATPVGVPGAVLPAGSYSVQVTSHLAKRYIIHVVDQSGSVKATFLGLPDPSISQPGKAMWGHDVKGVSYVKGWSFQPGPVRLEFVYPKEEAVAIAQANGSHVTAVDPASDGLVAKLSDLPAKDFELMTLWLLTPTHVGPGSPAGIKASRYDQVASLQHKPAVAQLPHTASGLGWFYLVGVLSFAGALGMRRFAVARGA